MTTTKTIHVGDCIETYAAIAERRVAEVAI